MTAQRHLEAVLALVPADGSWVLWVRVLAEAEELGIPKRVTRAALALLACFELETEQFRSGAQLRLRRRARAGGNAA